MSSGAKRNLILLAVLLILGGAAVILEHPFAERPEKYATYGPIYPDFDPENLWGLTITRGENEVKVLRTQSGWIVPSLCDFPADFNKIREVVGRVKGWKNDLRIGKTDSRHKRLGLAGKDATHVVLSDVNQNPMAEFFIGKIGGYDPKRTGPGGKLNPEDFVFYLRPLPGDDFFQINEFMLGSFSFQPEHWIRSKIFDYSKDDAVKLVTQGVEETLVFSREKKEDDWVVEGMVFPADQNQVNQTVDAISYLACSNVADPEAPPETYGLDAPRMTATVTLEGGQELRLLVGKEKDERTTYGKPEGGRYPMEIHTGNLDRIFKKKEDLVDKTLFAFSAWDAKKVTLYHPDETIVLERGERQWKISSPEGIEADPRQVNGVASTFSRLRHEGYVAKAGEDLAEYGLAEPTFRAVAEMEEETHTLLVGTKNEEGLNYAMKEGGEWIVLLSDKTLENIRRRAEELRQKTPEEIAAEKEAKEKAEEEKEAAESEAKPEAGQEKKAPGEEVDVPPDEKKVPPEEKVEPPKGKEEEGEAVEEPPE